MAQIFVNLPVTDLDRAKAFYEAIGYHVNPMFTDHNAACVVVEDEHSYFMLLTREYFSTFTKKPIADPTVTAQTSIAIALDTREAVDAMLATGLAAGGAEPNDPQDLGFMYSRDLDDPDGNALSFLWMDPTAAEQGPPADAETVAAAN
jgi:predicted lactoylglutathione lyase